MPNDLLNKIKSINNLLENYHLNKDFLKKICEQLSELIISNVYLYDPDGNIVSYSTHENYYCKNNDDYLSSKSMPEKYMKFTETLTNPILNIYDSKPSCTCPDIEECIYKNRYTSMVPVFYSHERIGAILLIKYNEPFGEEDQIICEHAFAIISLEMARKEIEEMKTNSLESESADIAFRSLSFTEMDVARTIFEKIENDEGIIIASKISNELFITRSIINNSLKKLESAGIILVKSLGVKGTYIKILNKQILIKIKQPQ